MPRFAGTYKRLVGRLKCINLDTITLLSNRRNEAVQQFFCKFSQVIYFGNDQLCKVR